MRFYHESDGDRDGHRWHYVVDRYADPLGSQRRTDVGSRGEARRLAREWNKNPPWLPWDTIQAARDNYKDTLCDHK